MGRLGRFDRILERENRPPTHQTRVLEKQTRCRPPEKSVWSAANRVRSAVAGGSGWPGLWIALAEIDKLHKLRVQKASSTINQRI